MYSVVASFHQRPEIRSHSFILHRRKPFVFVAECASQGVSRVRRAYEYKQRRNCKISARQTPLVNKVAGE